MILPRSAICGYNRTSRAYWITFITTIRLRLSNILVVRASCCTSVGGSIIIIMVLARATLIIANSKTSSTKLMALNTIITRFLSKIIGINSAAVQYTRICWRIKVVWSATR